MYLNLIQVERFKEVELVKMRMEEREKSRKEIQNARQEVIALWGGLVMFCIGTRLGIGTFQFFMI